MTEKDEEHFENSIKYWIWENGYVDGVVKVKNHCHIIGKYRGSARRGCNMKVKLNDKISMVFHNLKDYESHLVMQELGKFDFKINVMSNVFEKHMAFNINNKLFFI